MVNENASSIQRSEGSISLGISSVYWLKIASCWYFHIHCVPSDTCENVGELHGSSWCFCKSTLPEVVQMNNSNWTEGLSKLIHCITSIKKIKNKNLNKLKITSVGFSHVSFEIHDGQKLPVLLREYLCKWEASRRDEGPLFMRRIVAIVSGLYYLVYVFELQCEFIILDFTVMVHKV